jgi:hypothetical protein
LPADAAGALQVAAAWAVAERGAQELGDLLTLAPGVGDLPPDVARSWDRIRRLSLQMLAWAALADGDLPRLAQELMDELEERRRLILTSRTFAQTRRTYDSLAAELGIGSTARSCTRRRRDPRCTPVAVQHAVLAGRKTCLTAGGVLGSLERATTGRYLRHVTCGSAEANLMPSVFRPDSAAA